MRGVGKTGAVRAGAILLAAAAAALLLWMVMNAMKEKPTEENTAEYRGHGGTMKNPLAEIDTPDPSIVYKDGYYYMTFTHNGADIMVMKSRTLDFRQAVRKTVWYPPVGTMYSANIWAPEIQYLRGKWYIYFAADNGVNENHRMYALEADTDDPLGTWTFRGQIKDESDKWAIDGLALEHEGKLYFIWSGWEGDVNIQQNTYIAPMSDPLTVSGPRVLLSRPEFDWEKAGGPPYINEGQAILKKNGRVFLMYSGAGSWTPFYSIGTLMLEPGLDPLSPDNWRKFEEPLLVMDQEAGVYGPGHNTFVTSPDGSEDWIVYHATSGIHDGWNNRKARAQKIHWDEDGMPSFGKPLPLSAAVEVPSGTGWMDGGQAKRADGEWVFDLIPASQDAPAPVLIHYRNETGRTASATLSLEGGGSDPVSEELAPTEAGKAAFAYAEIGLLAGQNAIRLTADPAIALEAIEIPRFEAENGEVLGSAEAGDNPFASGRGAVRLDSDDGAEVRFLNVRVPEPGEYVLRFGITNREEKDVSLEVSVNGGKSSRVNVPVTERNIYQPTEVRAVLKAGPNTVTLRHASGVILVDYMDVVR
jgi:GH43 family beta-xylosidase